MHDSNWSYESWGHQPEVCSMKYCRHLYFQMFQNPRYSELLDVPHFFVWDSLWYCCERTLMSETQWEDCGVGDSVKWPWCRRLSEMTLMSETQWNDLDVWDSVEWLWCVRLCHSVNERTLMSETQWNDLDVCEITLVYESQWEDTGVWDSAQWDDLDV